MKEEDATMSLHYLSAFLHRYYGKKVIILLDKYDTPMQEAYVNGYWEELVTFTRSLFNATFKTNPHLERAIMTGITRVSRESIFSNLNNLKAVTTTSEEYADIYNPWSILNYPDTGKVETYWANSSSNSLVGKLIREGSLDVKQEFEKLIIGQSILTPVDEQIVYGELNGNEEGIWSLLLASGYLKVLRYEKFDEVDADSDPVYELCLTNREVLQMFRTMVKGWIKYIQ